MRRSWWRQLGIVVGIAVAISVAVVIATGCSSENATAKPTSTQTKGPGAEVMSLLAGIPQRGNTLGEAKAPVTVQYFGDLQCPYCKRFTLGALRSLIQSYVRDGTLKIEYRSMRTATRDPNTFRTQQVAALAAGKQNKMWNYIELFYHDQGEEDSGYVTESYLQGLAQQVSGLNLIAWTAARNDTDLAHTITTDARTVNVAGLTSTPSFLLHTTRAGTRYASAIEKLLTG